ncbi:MAG: ATP-binding cassette domain-containing protein [Chloroflexota bacterium]
MRNIHFAGERGLPGGPGEAPVAIRVRGLTVRRAGRLVLSVPDLGVPPQEVLGIVGPNGAGKTTLVLCLALLLTPTAGTINFDAISAKSGSGTLGRRRRMAVVFQDPLLMHTSVWENVALGLRFRGVSKLDTDERVEQWLARLDIAHLARRHARELSRGEAQRVNLARAFVVQPEILFLDEPFSNLDGPTHRALVDSLESILKETRITTLFVSHDLKDVVRLADRLAVLIDGAIRQLGRPREVFAYPLSLDVQRFIAAHRTGGGITATV